MIRSSTPGRHAARTAAVLTAAFALAVTMAPLTGTAQAHEAVTGSLSFSGEPGEYISGGQSYAYTPDTTEMFDISGPASQSGLGATVVTPEGERWALSMSAPYGQKLVPGTTYANARSWPEAQPEDPQLQFSATDRYCESGTGSFTVSHIVYGPHGYIREIDATFERTCSGSTLPVRGELHARMPEPAAELAIGVQLNTTGTVATRTGEITVGGTTTCNKPARVSINVSAYQTQKRTTANGSHENLIVVCEPGSPVPWTTSFPSNIDPTASFQPGAAVLRGLATADDRDYPVSVTDFRSDDITLVRS
ncbi:hypothetical protein ACFWPP_29825 [Streptomyces anulatus]|uniref:hypothetical protein n=1 Tax=Streptomyces TaxID=1883 RepID=UPI00093BCC92|nr:MULTISPECIES: hypothetical protein [unclassified Streptomyces]OKJ14670.1 hypothetical protein AMK20_02315 [Streptomyces sp. TSRI0261]QNQ35143.1 hypothetical protein HYC88_16490 [Streptomyces sp. CB00271]